MSRIKSRQIMGSVLRVWCQKNVPIWDVQLKWNVKCMKKTKEFSLKYIQLNWKDDDSIDQINIQLKRKAKTF